jgi:hypothetical protein
MRGFRSWPDGFYLPAWLTEKHSNNGLVAQSVEQRIENPCVGGSIPPRATRWFSPKVSRDSAQSIYKGLHGIVQAFFIFN